MDAIRRKEIGAFYTPQGIAHSLVSWAVRLPTDRMLDPSCGDGRFLGIHANSVGVEGDPHAAAEVHARAPGSLIHQGDFFAWAENTLERFECAAGNPPFIRYQRFTGETRESALRLCRRRGAHFNSLSSSWAPFLVATASLLLPGGRIAFVVPAEIGHAPYAKPLIEYLLRNFDSVKIVAVREKLFPDLSEDCWLLYCDGFGGSAKSIGFTRVQQFVPTERPPKASRCITLSEWDQWGGRIRPFLLSDGVLETYRSIAESGAAARISDIARIGIGYVTGANDFFHLRPSLATELGISKQFLIPAVRNGRDLIGPSITRNTVHQWWQEDCPNFLLRLESAASVSDPVRTYLDSAEGKQARQAYKCRNRKPWYVVPDVHIPDAFLSYMSGKRPLLVQNCGECVATNSVHFVRMKPGVSFARLQATWHDPLTELSCELEGHPLGGGMLKLEPREAGRVLVRNLTPTSSTETNAIADAVDLMRAWRHYG